MKNPGWEHLVGAYGTHWSRSEVDWGSPRSQKWQLLGRIGTNKPNVRICDFRTAAGVYVLESHGRPQYVGLARSSQGIGARLAAHHRDSTKTWTKFSWFAFDAVVDLPKDMRRSTHPHGWARVLQRENLRRPGMFDLVGELEAMFVTLLGHDLLQNIQNPKIPGADRWLQVVKSNYSSPGICHRVSRELFVNQKKFGSM